MASYTNSNELNCLLRTFRERKTQTPRPSVCPSASGLSFESTIFDFDFYMICIWVMTIARRGCHGEKSTSKVDAKMCVIHEYLLRRPISIE